PRLDLVNGIVGASGLSNRGAKSAGVPFALETPAGQIVNDTVKALRDRFADFRQDAAGQHKPGCHVPRFHEGPYDAARALRQTRVQSQFSFSVLSPWSHSVPLSPTSVTGGYASSGPRVPTSAEWARVGPKIFSRWVGCLAELQRRIIAT